MNTSASQKNLLSYCNLLYYCVIGLLTDIKLTPLRRADSPGSSKLWNEDVRTWRGILKRTYEHSFSMSSISSGVDGMRGMLRTSVLFSSSLRRLTNSLSLGYLRPTWKKEGQIITVSIRNTDVCGRINSKLALCIKPVFSSLLLFGIPVYRIGSDLSLLPLKLCFFCCCCCWINDFPHRFLWLRLLKIQVYNLDFLKSSIHIKLSWTWWTEHRWSYVMLPSFLPVT